KRAAPQPSRRLLLTWTTQTVATPQRNSRPEAYSSPAAAQPQSECGRPPLAPIPPGVGIQPQPQPASLSRGRPQQLPPPAKLPQLLPNVDSQFPQILEEIPRVVTSKPVVVTQ